MSKISLEYNGDLRNSLIHLESKTEILTDAPKTTMEKANPLALQT